MRYILGLKLATRIPVSLIASDSFEKEVTYILCCWPNSVLRLRLDHPNVGIRWEKHLRIDRSRFLARFCNVRISQPLHMR